MASTIPLALAKTGVLIYNSSFTSTGTDIIIRKIWNWCSKKNVTLPDFLCNREKSFLKELPGAFSNFNNLNNDQRIKQAHDAFLAAFPTLLKLTEWIIRDFEENTAPGSSLFTTAKFLKLSNGLTDLINSLPVCPVGRSLDVPEASGCNNVESSQTSLVEPELPPIREAVGPRPLDPDPSRSSFSSHKRKRDQSKSTSSKRTREMPGTVDNSTTDAPTPSSDVASSSQPTSDPAPRANSAATASRPPAFTPSTRLSEGRRTYDLLTPHVPEELPAGYPQPDRTEDTVVKFNEESVSIIMRKRERLLEPLEDLECDEPEVVHQIAETNGSQGPIMKILVVYPPGRIRGRGALATQELRPH